jgi:hypothetical protein
MGGTVRYRLSAIMEFRWVAGIALWTLMVGPIFDLSSSHPLMETRPARLEARRKSDMPRAQPHPTTDDRDVRR